MYKTSIASKRSLALTLDRVKAFTNLAESRKHLFPGRGAGLQNLTNLDSRAWDRYYRTPLSPDSEARYRRLAQRVTRESDIRRDSESDESKAFWAVSRLRELAKNEKLGDLASGETGLERQLRSYMTPDEFLERSPEFASLLSAQKRNASPEERERLLRSAERAGELREKLYPPDSGPKGAPFSRRTLKTVAHLLRSVPSADIETIPEIFRGIAKNRVLRSSNEHPMDGVEDHGNNRYTITGPTGVSYALQKETSGLKTMHRWGVFSPKDGKRVGYFTVKPIHTEKDELDGGIVKMAFPFGQLPSDDEMKAIRDFKAGRKFYAALRHHYGRLESDTGSTSSEAANMYKRLANIGWARELPEKNSSSQQRWEIRPHNIKRNENKLRALKQKQGK
jgi:hypothetical protein